MADRPDYIDADAQGHWERAGGVIRSDPTGSVGYRQVYVDSAGYDWSLGMSPATARTLGRALIAAADYAESGDIESPEESAAIVDQNLRAMGSAGLEPGGSQHG